MALPCSFQELAYMKKQLLLSLSNPQFVVKEGQEVVKIDPKYFRPTEVELLIGDPTKANNRGNWGGDREYDLDALIEEMVSYDLELFKRDRYLKDGGHQFFHHNE